MKSLNEVLENKINAQYYGTRILLPFACEILKVIIEKDIITDFSIKSRSASQKITENYTELYLFGYNELQASLSKYEMIKMIVVEKGDDIFDVKSHEKVGLRVVSNHQLSIERIGDDILFFD